MSDKQPAEFGENGAVVNAPHMTPARRDSYSGIQSDTQDNLVVYKWWAHMPGVFVTVIGTMSISRFDENISMGWRLGLFAIVVLMSAALGIWIPKLPGARK